MGVELQQAVSMKGHKSSKTDRPITYEAEIPLTSQLLSAALAGDWKKTERILDSSDHNLATTGITPSGETILHIAATTIHEYFVKNLVKIMKEKELAVTNKAGSTALHLASLAGNVDIAKLLVSKNSGLPTMENNSGMTSLLLSAISGNGEMVEYLLPLSDFDSWSDANKSELLNACIETELFSIAREIVECYPTSAMCRDSNGVAPLDVLAQNSLTLACRSEPESWKRILSALSCKILSRDDKLEEYDILLERIWQNVPPQDIENPIILEDIAGPAFVAAELGNYAFLVKLLLQRPEFLYIVNKSQYSIYHIAIKHRHELIFSLIYEIGSLKDLVANYRDEEGNTMLHLAAKIAPQSQLNLLPGPVLQMHRELLWYKEVEKIVPPKFRYMKNATDGLTPPELFAAEHRKLIKEAEKWKNKISYSLMLVATLIVVVIFVSSFTLPSVYNNNGELIFLNERSIVAFTFAETLAMLSSTTSLIIFLSILTSDYKERDFLESLPYRLVSGILTLLVSLALIMVGFWGRLILYVQQSSAEVSIRLGLLAFIPLMFVILKPALLADIIASMFASRHMFRSRHMLIPQ